MGDAVADLEDVRRFAAIDRRADALELAAQDIHDAVRINVYLGHLNACLGLVCHYSSPPMNALERVRRTVASCVLTEASKRCPRASKMMPPTISGSTRSTR